MSKTMGDEADADWQDGLVEAGRESHCSYCGSEYWRCHTMEQAKHCNPSPKRQKRIQRCEK